MIELNDLIGKPFADDPEDAFGPRAFSCYGLLWEVYRRFGIDIPQINISVTACKEASQQEIMEQAAKYWEPIQRPETPCAVLIQSTRPEYADHIGCYLGSGKMLHITINRAVELAKLRDWKYKIKGYFRYVGDNHSSS